MNLRKRVRIPVHPRENELSGWADYSELPKQETSPQPSRPLSPFGYFPHKGKDKEYFIFWRGEADFLYWFGKESEFFSFGEGVRNVGLLIFHQDERASEKSECTIRL